MKTSVKWLKDYIDFDFSLQEFSDHISLAGLEVETIEAINKIDEHIVVGEILSREKHPDADKLSVCEVTDGTETFQIVCGAPNCDAGNKVPMAKVGADFGGGFVIKKSKLRGIKSFGMLCSASELNLIGDDSGLMILGEEFKVGEKLQDHYDFDYMVETEVTPNRPDWLSQTGIARELAAIVDSSYKMPEIKLSETDEQISDFASLTVTANDLCPRYTARVIKDIKIAPSPEWMQKYLTAVGLRCINNVVDITNFVLMELGQPLHAFDYDKISQQTLLIRRANDGEKMPLLDGSEHKLTSDMLVIADADKPIALAGIMGGGNSEIDDQTTTVLLESATFDPSNIRATCNKLSIHSDSSYRYERGVDIEMAEMASARAAQLLCEYAGGTLVAGMLDSNPNPYTPHQVSCRFSKVNEVLGVEVPKTQVLDIFKRLELPVIADTEADCTVAIPSFRLDLTREIDLIEEVSRIFGLNNIPASPIEARSGGPIKNDSYYPIQELRDQLLGLGLSECYNYSMMNKDLALNKTGFDESELIILSNPLSSELSVMRPSLLPGMMTVVAHNIAHANNNLDLFELGRVISSRAKQPEENYEICMAMTGLVHPERFASEKKEVKDFYDLKGAVEGLLEARRIVNFKFEAKDHPFFEIGQSASLTVNGKVLGYLGQVSDAVLGKARNIYPIFMAFFNADALMAVNGKKKIFEELPTSPATSRDISFIANDSLSHAEVIGAVKTAKVKMLESVELVDIYVDENAKSDGKKSMTYSFTYRHPSATLTVEEGNQMHEKVIAALNKRLTIEIR